MNSKTSINKIPRKAVYFYPENQCFKVDCETKTQLNNPILIFKEASPGSSLRFFSFFKKEFKKLINSDINQTITTDFVEQTVKKHHLFNINVVLV